VGNRDDVDVVAFNRVQQLVWKPAQRQASDIFPLDRARQGPSLDARKAQLNSARNSSPRRALDDCSSARLIELAARFGEKITRISICRGFPLRDALHLAGTVGPPGGVPPRQARCGRFPDRVCRDCCNTWSTRSKRSAGSSFSAIATNSRVPMFISLQGVDSNQKGPFHFFVGSLCNDSMWQGMESQKENQ